MAPGDGDKLSNAGMKHSCATGWSFQDGAISLGKLGKVYKMLLGV